MSLPEDLITPREAARLLHLHVSAVYRMVMRGRIRAWKRGTSRYLLSRQEVMALLAPEPPQPDALRPRRAESWR